MDYVTFIIPGSKLNLCIKDWGGGAERTLKAADYIILKQIQPYLNNFLTILLFVGQYLPLKAFPCSKAGPI